MTVIEIGFISRTLWMPRSYKKQFLHCGKAYELHQRDWTSKVVQIITDNAQACKFASTIVERNHPLIF